MRAFALGLEGLTRECEKGSERHSEREREEGERERGRDRERVKKSGTK